MSDAKGLLVYATGKTEAVEPLGQTIVRPCEHCGSQLFFETVERLAEDQRTVTPGSVNEGKLERIAALTGRAMPPRNGGCVIYAQRRG